MSRSTELLAQRYVPGDVPSRVEENPVLDLLLSHRSVRSFSTAPLGPEVVPTLVAAAQSAATWGNLQPWSVVAVADPERKARFAVIAGNQAHVEQAPLLLVWLADLSRLRRVAAARGIDAKGLSTLDLFVIAISDASLAAQNAVVAAESLGLGTVYIGRIRRELASVARELNLPAEVLPLFGLSVGHPDTAKPTEIKPRLSQQVVLHLETYDPSAESQAIAAYDATIEAGLRRQGRPVVPWSHQATDRLKENEPDRGSFKELVHALGFGLT